MSITGEISSDGSPPPLSSSSLSLFHLIMSICRYNEMFFIADTCRSASLYEWIDSPGVNIQSKRRVSYDIYCQVLSTSSSLTHEESYSYDIDENIGVYVIDRYERDWWIWSNFFIQLLSLHTPILWWENEGIEFICIYAGLTFYNLECNLPVFVTAKHQFSIFPISISLHEHNIVKKTVLTWCFHI